MANRLPTSAAATTPEITPAACRSTIPARSTSRGGQPDIAVVGQVVGRSVNLAADLGNGRYLFGTGTVYNAAGGCPSIAGGPMTMQTVGGTTADAPAKLLAPVDQVIIERNGAWSLRTAAC